MPPPHSSATPLQARLGVSLIFFSNGAMCTALLPRYPEIKAAYGLGDGRFGLLVVAFAAGAMIATGFAGRVIRGLGTLATVGVMAVALGAALAVAGASTTVWLLVIALMVAGAVDGVMDAAMNVQGVLVERWRGRSWINSFHAIWSVGAATGGAIGAAAAAAGLGIPQQMIGSGMVFATVALAGSRLARVPDVVRRDLSEGNRPTRSGPSARRLGVWPLLLPLVAVAISGTLIEDVANNWAILFLGREAHAPQGWAGLGLSVTLLAQFAGRLWGDPLTNRFDRARVARAGGVLIAIGAAFVIGAPIYQLAVLGFALMGFGSATLVPAAFAAAGRLPGVPEGTGIALLSWLMRLGFLLTSPIIGLVSELSSLRTAMLVPLCAGLGAAVIASRLGRPTTQPKDFAGRPRP